MGYINTIGLGKAGFGFERIKQKKENIKTGQATPKHENH